MSNSINNLNIFTFIKDIYQSLKHIDKNFNDSNTTINSRLIKLEDNQLVILDKLSSIELLLSRLDERNTSNALLNKSLENELLDKMTIMNNNNLFNTKIGLKSEELTFANILENDYSFQDIDKSLVYSNIDYPSIEEKQENMNANVNANKQFTSSSGSGSSYYSPNKSNNNNSNSSLSNDISDGKSDGISDGISDDNDNLNKLLF